MRNVVQDSTVLYPGTACLTGRGEFLHTLRETLLHKQVVLIAGPPGVGKTTAVRAYAALYADEYRYVAWMDASTQESFLAGLRELADHFSLCVGTSQKPAQVGEAVQRWLGEQPDFLLIVDNLATLEMPGSQSERLPVRGHCILIAREPEPPKNFLCLTLNPLDEHSGALLLLRRADLSREDVSLDQASGGAHAASLELVRELQGLPLALNLAGAFIKEHGCTAEHYLQAYRNHPAHGQAPDRQGAYGTPHIEVCCALTAEALDTSARELLYLSAFLAPTLPLSLLRQMAVLLEMESDAAAPAIPPVLEALDALQACGLLTESNVTGALEMHPLLQAAVRRSLPLDWQQRRVELALRAIYSLLLSMEKEPLSVRLRLAGHIRRLSEISEEWPVALDEAAAVFNWAGSLLWEQGFLREAEPLLNRGLVIWERTLGPAHPLVAALTLNLAVISAQLEHFTLAESLAQRAVTAKSHALGVNHPDVLIALNNLGRIYAHQKKDAKAKLCYEKAILVAERCKLENHPNFALSLYDLAMLEIGQERFAEAEPLLLRACAIWEQGEGEEEHLRLYQVWHVLAEIALRQQQWEQAREYFLRFLPACCQKLGMQHSITQNCLERLAEACARQGRFEEAAACLHRLLKARVQVPKPDLLGAANCLNSLASIYLAQGQHDKALPLLEHAWHISKRRPADPVQASVLENLAVIYAARGEQSRAIDYLEQALVIRERCQGAEHLDLLQCLSGLGTLYLEQGRLDEAEKMLLRALGLYQCAQRPEDLELDAALENLALIALKRQRYEQARMYLDRLRGVREQALGEDSPDSAQVLQKLALVALAQEEWEEAERFYWHALAIYERIQGDEHQVTLACLDELAAFYVRWGKLERAEAIVRRVLAARERELGAEHPGLARVVLALGQICLSRQRFVEAESCLQRALALFEHTSPVSPSMRALLLVSLAAALSGQGRSEQGILLKEQARQLLNTVAAQSPA